MPVDEINVDQMSVDQMFVGQTNRPNGFRPKDVELSICSIDNILFKLPFPSC
jgi:hypothetical protein